MKINKPILLTSSALLALSLLGGAKAQPVSASQNTITVTAPYYNDYITVYNRQGKPLKEPYKVKKNQPIKTYGSISINQRYSLFESFPPTRIINGVSYYSLGKGGYVKTNNVGSATKDGKLGIRFNTYIYDKNGKRLKTFNGKKAYIPKNTQFQYLGPLYGTRPETFYNIGNGRYVKSSDITKLNGKGVLRLNYNSYLYNRKGQRIKGTKLVKNSIINYAGKIKSANKDAVYTFYKGSGNQFYQLDQYKIKGKTYYAVGGGRYINAYNVGQVDSNYVYKTGSTYIVPRNDLSYRNSNLQPIDEVARAGKKLKTDLFVVNGQGDNAELYARVKVGKNYRYLWWGDYSEYPQDDPTSNFQIRFNLRTHDYEDLTKSYFSFKSRTETPIYNIDAQQQTLPGSKITTSDDVSNTQNIYNIDGMWYLWDAKENKAELFYHLQNRIAFFASKGYEDIGNSFVKADDVNVYGIKLTPQNTPEEAKADATLASTSQKDQLKEYVDEAPSVRETDKYKLSSYFLRANYDGVVSDAEKAMKSDKTTALEVKELLWQLKQDKADLNGAKVKVKNIKDITFNEANQILQVMNNYYANSFYSSGFAKDSVAIYQHWAHKDGYYPTYRWNSSKVSVFMLRQQGKKNRVLDVSDFATEK